MMAGMRRGRLHGEKRSVCDVMEKYSSEFQQFDNHFIEGDVKRDRFFHNDVDDADGNEDGNNAVVDKGKQECTKNGKRQYGSEQIGWLKRAKSFDAFDRENIAVSAYYSLPLRGGGASEGWGASEGGGIAYAKKQQKCASEINRTHPNTNQRKKTWKCA